MAKNVVKKETAFTFTTRLLILLLRLSPPTFTQSPGRLDRREYLSLPR